MSPRPLHGATCVAPLGDVADEGDPLLSTPLCGRPATTTREVEGILLPLCARHAAEYDADLAADREQN